MGSPLHRLEGLADDVLPGLGQHLDGHVVGDHVPLDQGPDEIVLRVRGGREAHLDLLEADVHQEPEELQLILQGHGIDQGLVAVPEIHAAPDGGLLDGVLPHPVVGHLRGHMVSFAVFLADCGLIHILRPFLSVLLHRAQAWAALSILLRPPVM